MNVPDGQQGFHRNSGLQRLRHRRQDP